MRIYTSRLKSDVTIMYSYTTREFRRFENILGKNCHVYLFMDFQDVLAQNGAF